MAIDQDPGGVEKEFVEVRLYHHARAIAAVTNEILKEGDTGTRLLATGEFPQYGSPRLGFLWSVYNATVANNPNIGVPGAIEADQIGQVISVLLVMGKTEEEIRAQLLESNPDWAETIDKSLQIVGGIDRRRYCDDISLGSWEYIKALRNMDWDGERLDEYMDMHAFYLLINQCIERCGGSAALVVANSQPGLMTDWLQDNLIENGNEAGYRFVALLEGQFRGKSATIYPKVKEIAAALPCGRTAALIGHRLIREDEYRPPEFGLTSQELNLLTRGREFSLDEIYDIASQPVLRQALFDKSPFESDDELGSHMEELLQPEGINILEYLQYLVKTGGCFRQGSTAILEDKINDYDPNQTYWYLNAQHVWAEWRRIARVEGDPAALQETLDAWTLLSSSQI